MVLDRIPFVLRVIRQQVNEGSRLFLKKNRQFFPLQLAIVLGQRLVADGHGLTAYGHAFWDCLASEECVEHGEQGGHVPLGDERLSSYVPQLRSFLVRQI